MDNQGETERESRTRKNEESQNRNHIESDHEFNKKCDLKTRKNINKQPGFSPLFWPDRVFHQPVQPALLV